MTSTLEDLDLDVHLELTLLVFEGLLGGARLLVLFAVTLLIDGLLEVKVSSSIDGDLDDSGVDGDDDGDFSIIVEICDMCDLKIENIIFEHTYDTYTCRIQG